MSEALENLAVGTLVIFGGYTDLPEGDDPIFEEGASLEITEVTEDGGYMVKDEDGNTDTVFPEELSGLADEDDGEVAELDWKDVKKGVVVEVVNGDDEVVVVGEVTAKTAANVTIDGTKYTKKDHGFFPAPEEEAEEEAEAEAEAETDGEETDELSLDQIEKGMEIEVVDDNDEVVASGSVVSVTKTAVKIGRKSYKASDFGFFLPEAVEEEAEEPEHEEVEPDADEVAELALDDIKKGDLIEVVDADDAVVASGAVASVTKTGVKIGRKAYPAKDFAYFPPEEAEVVEEEKPAATAKDKPASKAKAKDKPAVKESKKEQELTVTDTDSLAAILEESDALEAAKDIVETIEEGYFNLGGLLAHIHVEELYLQAGYEGNKAFDQYVAEELGIEYRKAMYLIKIYTHFANLGVDESRLAEIGWSKAKELVGIATEDNFDELVDYANNHSRDELKDYIKTTYVDGGDGTAGSASDSSNKVKRTTFKFSAHEDQANVILEAIEQAKDQHGITDDSEAMIAIFTEWSQLVDGIDIPLSVAVENLEARYGVKVTTEQPKPAQQEKKAPAKKPADKAADKKPAAKEKAPAKRSRAKK